MRFAKVIRTSSVICGMLAQIAATLPAGATTIIQSTGNSAASVPLGYYAPYVPYNLTPTVYAVGWTQTSTYTNLDVFANLFTVSSPGIINYALVTALGPGTSFAANGIIRGSTATPTNPTDVDLFHLASLGPGTYYLVLDSPSANTAWQYNYPFQTNDTMDSGVTFLGNQASYAGSINNSYTPGSSFSSAFYPVEFRVTGTAAGTPEPATFGITGLVLVGIATILRRRAEARRQPRKADPTF